MKCRNGNFVSGVARLLFVWLVLVACQPLVTEIAWAQRPAPTPVGIKDKQDAGEAERVEIGGGKYKLVYRNKDGQAIREEEYVLGVLVKKRWICEAYPDGQEANVFSWYFGAKGWEASERVQFDRFGNPQERVIERYYPTRFQREKWNPRTKRWEPAPERRRWNPATGSWEEVPENERLDPETGIWFKVPPSATPAPKDASYNPTSRGNCSLSVARGFAVASVVAGGLNTTTFDTPRGKIRVNLPDDMAAGDTLSGTVVAEPQGQDDKTRTQNQGELSGYVVELAKQQSSSTDRILKLDIPAAISTTYLILKDKKGKEVARSEVPVVRQPPPAVERFDLPTIGQQGRPVEVTGAFDGDFGTTNLKVGGEEMEILAESPRKLVARNTSNKTGLTQLVLQEQGRTSTGEFRSLGIKLSAPKLDLLKGEQTTLTVTVLGLEGIKAPVPLVLENKSPGVISMGSANLERISISPSQVQGGTYTTERPLTGIQRGAFAIVGTVISDGQRSN